MYKEKPEAVNWQIMYLIDAPWAHPIWSQYILLAYDLTTPIEGQPNPTLYRPDVTHEVMLFALDPDNPKIQPRSFQDQKIEFLSPANFGYQLTSTNKDLEEILDHLAERFERRLMSPDTDYRGSHDAFFKMYNAVSLLRSSFDGAFHLDLTPKLN